MSVFVPRVVMVTGGAGFIGSNLIQWLLRHVPQVEVVNVDLLTYAGDLGSLEEVSDRHGPNGDGRYWFRLLGRPLTLVEHVEDRPGHDRRYALDGRKITGELGWRPARRFEEGLVDTVRWYVDHRDWWERMLQRSS